MKFPNGIELENVEGGMLVRQQDRAYLAKGWELAPATVELVETALGAGLPWMIRDGHPQAHALWPKGQGRVYLAFSPTQKKQWAFALDSFNPSKGDYGVVVFNGKYHEQFLAHGVPFEFEKRNTGSGHMVVQRENVLDTVRLLGSLDHDVLYISRKAESRGGFLTEYDIQRAMLEGWGKLPFANRYDAIADEFPVDGGLTSRRIDILAKDRQTGDWLVIELKRAQAPISAVDQINGYLLSLGQRDDFVHDALRGALVAERVSQTVRAAAENAGIEAYEIAHPCALTRVV